MRYEELRNDGFDTDEDVGPGLFGFVPVFAASVVRFVVVGLVVRRRGWARRGW